ncbi:MAG: alanine racemase [Candidatus Xenobiia bacterium LiM19]
MMPATENVEKTYETPYSKTHCHLNWIEIDRQSLTHNLQLFRRLVGKERKLLVVVKSNAYGHGICEVSEISMEGGADWLGVYSLEEGLALRSHGLKCPVLVMGYIPAANLRSAIENGLTMGVSSLDVLKALSETTGASGLNASVHLKLETGLNRLGLHEKELNEAFAILHKSPGISVEGLYTHFANIEDTLCHDFAQQQIATFKKLSSAISVHLGGAPLIRHSACTAAALLFPDTYFEMVRAGIGTYGMWPSKETLITALETQKHLLELQPIITWKSRIAQLKRVKPGDTVGYGRSYRVTRPARIAVIPTGYADGYDRALSNRGYVLIDGKEAPVMGRICMNMFMVDVTHIPKASLEDEVVLLGRQGNESISADTLAELIGTINYEVTTRISPLLPRVVTQVQSK